MPINIDIKIVPFGQARLEMGKSVPISENVSIAPIREKAHYHEPQETGSRIYEQWYQEELKNYIVPISTG